MQHDDIVIKYPPSMENVLLILHELQNKHPRNYLAAEDLAWAADYLNVTTAQIHGLSTYYTLFSLKPRGRHIIRVCRSPVCHMLGADRIFDQFKRILNIAPGDTTPDGLFTLEPTECIGQCDIAPCLAVDDAVYGATDQTDIEAVLKRYKHPE